jgi:hypothetical protein
MSEEHHDAELCKRLGMKMNLFTQEHGGMTLISIVPPNEDDNFIPLRAFDPCCNPAHNYLVEQRLAELGWEYAWVAGAHIASFEDGKTAEIWEQHGIGHRLHATSLAADKVEEIPDGVTKAEVQFRHMHHARTGEWLTWDRAKIEMDKWLNRERS